MRNLIDGEWREGTVTHPNINPNTGGEVSQSHLASAKDIEDAASAAHQAFRQTKRRPAWRRAEILETVSRLLAARKDELAQLMTDELGRPITYNKGEVDRGVLTLKNAAEEAKRLGGEYLPMDLQARAEHCYGWYRHEAIGPVIAITPFNFPVNLLMHKLAPAIAAGCTISVKVPPQTPDTPRKICELFVEAGCVSGEINCFDCLPEVAQAAVEDERYKLLTFTGSPKVGWMLKQAAGKKRVILELGNASGAIVHKDVTEIEAAAQKLAVGAFAAQGQVCISVQRIFVHDEVYDSFRSAFVAKVGALSWGDASDPDAVGAALIDDDSAERVMGWVNEARSGGAKLLVGGKREGRLVHPTVLEGVGREMKVACEEVFGPVVSLFRYDDDTEALLDALNATPFGLQAGVFTDSLDFAHRIIDGADVAAVMVNELPIFRVDHMPYGGVKDSGLGREGPKYALEEYTEKKLVVVNQKPWA